MSPANRVRHQTSMYILMQVHTYPQLRSMAQPIPHILYLYRQAQASKPTRRRHVHGKCIYTLNLHQQIAGVAKTVRRDGLFSQENLQVKIVKKIPANHMSLTAELARQNQKTVIIIEDIDITISQAFNVDIEYLHIYVCKQVVNTMR